MDLEEVVTLVAVAVLGREGTEMELTFISQKHQNYLNLFIVY